MGEFKYEIRGQDCEEESWSSFLLSSSFHPQLQHLDQRPTGPRSAPNLFFQSVPHPKGRLKHDPTLISVRRLGLEPGTPRPWRCLVDSLRCPFLDTVTHAASKARSFFFSSCGCPRLLQLHSPSKSDTIRTLISLSSRLVTLGR